MLGGCVRRMACCSRSWSRLLSTEAGATIEEKLRPSNAFLDGLTKEQKKNFDQTLAELEIFVYMGTYIPEKLSDLDWKRSLELETIKDKVSFWEYVAVKHRREEGKDRRKKKGQDHFKATIAAEMAKYEKGEMGYGPGMYQLIGNPLRNQKKIHHIEGTRVYHSMELGLPKIAFDLQYIATDSRRSQAELGNQIQYTISENLSSRRPFPFTFVNTPAEGNEWLEKCVGFYGGVYTNQTLLPDFTTSGIKDTFKQDREIVYISRYARDIIDGPLKADVIGICVSMDQQRESLGAARRAKVRAVRLPINKYVKWNRGPQYLPLPNVLNVLRQVHQSGGDWETALRNNISKRHLYGSEDEEKVKAMTDRRKHRESARRELIEAIAGATR